MLIAGRQLLPVAFQEEDISCRLVVHVNVPVKKILMIDDDRELCDLLATYLRTEGFSLDAAYEGKKGITMAATGMYDLLILDIMLPGGLDGLAVLQKIRARMSLPVLILSAKGDEIDRIVGLEMGADDYLPKPFNPRELAARLRTVLRRSKQQKGGENVCMCEGDDLKIDVGGNTCTCAGNSVHLTPLEFSILHTLLTHAGDVVTRENLAGDVLERPLEPYDRNIDVHVSQLRKKIGKRNDGRDRIKSVRGLGYIYTFPENPS